MKVTSRSKIKKYIYLHVREVRDPLQTRVRQTPEKRNTQNGENQSEEAGREDMLWITSMGLKPEEEGALVEARGREERGRSLLPQIWRCHCLGRD